MRLRFMVPALAVIAAAVACGGSEKEATPPASGAAAAANPSVKLTGRVIVVEAITDDKGNYFKPARIEAHAGDVVRFTLVAGVHNVHFLPDSNPEKTGLPATASDFLQIPGQTWDFTVALAPGHYYFQCDPHALLGMQGHLEVEGEK